MKKPLSISLKTSLTIQILLVSSLIPMDIFLGEIKLDYMFLPYLFFGHCPIKSKLQRGLYLGGLLISKN